MENIYVFCSAAFWVPPLSMQCGGIWWVRSEGAVQLTDKRACDKVPRRSCCKQTLTKRKYKEAAAMGWFEFGVAT